MHMSICESYINIPTEGIETVMVFSPHPDDDVLGCGGAILTHVSLGHRVIIVYMTSGEAAYWPEGSEKLALLREIEAKKAAAQLGVSECIFLRAADSALRNSAEEMISNVGDLFETYSPNLVYMPHRLDGHDDHAMTHTIVIEARKAQLQKKEVVKTICFLGYEVWTPLQHITHICNIQNYMAQKLNALREHVTQITYVDYVTAVEALNTYRGIMHLHGSFAECFQEEIIIL